MITKIQNTNSVPLAVKNNTLNRQNSNMENSLERTPNKDTVNFQGHIKEKSVYDNLNVKDGMLGKREISGTIDGKNVNLKLVAGYDVDELEGTINGKNVFLQIRNGVVNGKMPDEHENMLPDLKRLMQDKRKRDLELKIFTSV